MKEEIENDEEDIEDEETGADEASHEDQDEESEDQEAEPEEDDSEGDADEAEDDSTGIDFKGELEKLESGEKKPKSEKEKAERALHFNAERLRELGGDPASVLKIKAPEEGETKTPDVREVVNEQFADRDARALAKSDDEYKVIMWYVTNRKLSVQDAYLLANKGRIQRSLIEAKRGQVDFGKPNIAGKKKPSGTIPKHPGEALLARRGMVFNPATKTYQGKYYEEFYDPTDKTWKSRKLAPQG